MALYLDVHHHVDFATAPPDAHARDLEVAPRHGVTFIRYWYDEASGKVFCLWDAPSKEAAAAVHRDAHGIMADEIWEVKEGV